MSPWSHRAEDPSGQEPTSFCFFFKFSGEKQRVLRASGLVVVSEKINFVLVLGGGFQVIYFVTKGTLGHKDAASLD